MSERGHGLDPWPVSRKRREVVCCTIFDDIGSTDYASCMHRSLSHSLNSDSCFLCAEFSNYIRHVPLLQKMQCFEAHIFDNSKSSEQYFALIQELIETSSQRLSLVETRSNVQRQVIAQKHIDAKSETAAFFEQYAKETTYVVDAVGHVIANRMRVENVRNEPSGTPFTAASQAAVDGEEKDMILRGRVEAKEEAKLVPKTSLSEILRNRAASTGNLDANDDHQKADGTGISSNVASNSRNASQQIRILHIENDAKSSLQVKAKEPTGKQVARKGDVAPPTTGHKAVKAPARGIRQTEIAKAIPQRSKAKPIAAKMSSDVGNRDFSKAGVRKTTKPTAKTHTQKRVLENQRSTESVKGAVKVKEEPEAKKRRLDALMDKWPVTHERRTGVINALRETLYRKSVSLSKLFRYSINNILTFLLSLSRILQQLQLPDADGEDTLVRSRSFPLLSEHCAVLRPGEGHDSVR